MKILVLARRHDQVPVEEMQPHFQAEVQAIWDLYSQGICREFYTRADQPGAAVLTVECATTEVARQALAKLPLVKLNMIDLDLIPLAPFTNLTRLFQAANEPARAYE
jgi:hypothetical protein